MDFGPGVDPASPQWHRGWAKVAVALVLAGQGMAFGLAVNLTPPDSAVAWWVLHGSLAGSAAAVFGLLGGPLARECLATLRAGRVTVDALFMVTLSGAFAVSVFSTLRREGPVFYELVAILLAVYTVGKLLGARSRSRAARAIEHLRSEYDACLVAGEEGRLVRVASGQVAVGDEVLVGAGEAVGVDGVITMGEGWVRTTPLTGEPTPRLAGPGDAILAGMVSVDGVFTVRATAAGGRRKLDGMLRAIGQAGLQPSRLQAEADRIAARFVPAVVATACATFGVWWWLGGVVAAVENGLAVLVVACPCALGLATPLGVWSGLASLGRLGIVARSGDFLEALAAVDVALFDKTGTLCEPDLGIAHFRVHAASPLEAVRLRAALAAAERGVAHPVAAALRAHGEGPGTGGWETVEARVVSGRGLRARVRAAGDGRMRTILAGSAALLAEAGVRMEEGEGGSEAGRVRVCVAVDGVHAATIDLDESPRARADALFDELMRLGLRVEILTGDPDFSPRLWPAVRREAGLKPEDKAERVRALQRTGARVLFVGDGINDAAALAVADASLAVRQGSDLARAHAQAVVAGEGLGTVPDAVRLARAVRSTIRGSLVFSVIYNACGMLVAAAGWLHPVVAALAMAGSSVFVASRSLRFGSFSEKQR